MRSKTTDTRHGQPFLNGLFGGALIGTVAAVLFAPQIYAAFKNFRGQLTDVVSEAGGAAAGAYRQATMRAGDTADNLQQKGRGVTRGAEDVKERETEARAELDQDAADATRRSS